MRPIQTSSWTVLVIAPSRKRRRANGRNGAKADASANVRVGWKADISSTVESDVPDEAGSLVRLGHVDTSIAKKSLYASQQCRLMMAIPRGVFSPRCKNGHMPVS